MSLSEQLVSDVALSSGSGWGLSGETPESPSVYLVETSWIRPELRPLTIPLTPGSRLQDV